MELEKVKRIGEPAYMAEVEREAWQTIAGRPFRFLGLTLRRILNTWTCLWNFPPRLAFDETGLPNVLFYTLVSLLAFAGLWRAIRDRRKDAVALVIPVIVFPVVSYVTHPEMRYRHPIDPVLVVLVAYGIEGFRERRLESAARSAADERKH